MPAPRPTIAPLLRGGGSPELALDAEASCVDADVEGSAEDSGGGNGVVLDGSNVFAGASTSKVSVAR